MKVWKILLIIFVIIFTIFLLIYKPILRPSYFSIVAVCAIDGEDILAENNLTVGGQTIITYNETGVENITVIIYGNDTYLRKHETIHVVQARQNKLFGCTQILFAYLNEVEAYTMQNLPDKIFIKIYGEIIY